MSGCGSLKVCGWLAGASVRAARCGLVQSRRAACARPVPRMRSSTESYPARHRPRSTGAAIAATTNLKLSVCLSVWKRRGKKRNRARHFRLSAKSSETVPQSRDSSERTRSTMLSIVSTSTSFAPVPVARSPPTKMQSAGSVRGSDYANTLPAVGPFGFFDPLGEHTRHPTHHAPTSRACAAHSAHSNRSHAPRTTRCVVRGGT